MKLIGFPAIQSKIIKAITTSAGRSFLRWMRHSNPKQLGLSSLVMNSFRCLPLLNIRSCFNFWLISTCYSETTVTLPTISPTNDLVRRGLGIQFNMLRRNKSERLDRRKSTSSIHSKHESIDPELARQHAHAAATLAFARAQDRNKADVGHRGNRHSRSTTVSGYIEREAMPQHAQTINDTRPEIRRQQSVRFVGPTAVQRRRSFINRSSQPLLEPKISFATLRPMAMTTSAPVPAAYRPPSRSSSIGKASTGRGRPESLVNAAAAYNEYYTPEDDIASTPSSYRRIRRSKSMFSPLKAPSVFYTNGTPEHAGSSQFSAQDPPTSSRSPRLQSYEAPLRFQRSKSFLRGGRRDHSVQSRNDEAVQLARDRFFQQTTEQRLREQPSFLFRSKSQREDKPFRKSVRSNSTNDPVSLGHNVPAREFGFRVKARKASNTLKEKFRKVFGLHKEPVTVPNQQVDARETHVREYQGDSWVGPNLFADIPHPTKATLSHVVARPPSLHEASSNQQLRSYAGSVKSTRSDTSVEKSRVTSWNSTAVNTLTNQAAKLQAERELQRLSIINENGTHMPSSSFSRQKLNQTSAYPHHHRPSKSAGIITSPVGPVDSARVYSALMKRLDENAPKEKLEASMISIEKDIIPSTRLRQRSSSLSSSQRSRTPATIRHVISEGSDSSSIQATKHDHQWTRTDSIHSARAENMFGTTGAHIHQWAQADPLREARMRQEDDVFSPKGAATQKLESANILERYPSRLDISTHDLSRQASTKTSYHTVPESFGLTPQEIGNYNEPVIQPIRPLRESRSTFFGGTSIAPARTTSPFRRALAEGDYKAANTQTPTNDAVFSLSDERIANPLYLGPFADNIYSQGSVKAYSESVYSRTTSGQGPGVWGSTSSLLGADNNAATGRLNTGEAVITENVRFSYRPTKPSNKFYNAASSNGSTEWKTWMSSEVSKLERAKEIYAWICVIC